MNQIPKGLILCSLLHTAHLPSSLKHLYCHKPHLCWWRSVSQAMQCWLHLHGSFQWHTPHLYCWVSSTSILDVVDHTSVNKHFDDGRSIYGGTFGMFNCVNVIDRTFVDNNDEHSDWRSVFQTRQRQLHLYGGMFGMFDCVNRDNVVDCVSVDNNDKYSGWRSVFQARQCQLHLYGGTFLHLYWGTFGTFDCTSIVKESNFQPHYCSKEIKTKKINEDNVTLVALVFLWINIVVRCRCPWIYLVDSGWTAATPFNSSVLNGT